MALTYNYTGLASIDKFTDIEHQEASRFAWVLMAIDMHDITEKNVDEIVFRLLFAKQCNQNFLVGDFTKGSLKAFIKTYIGYETNVGYKTRNAYMKKIMRIVENKVKDMGVN
jgi:hypothetical protein